MSKSKDDMPTDIDSVDPTTTDARKPKKPVRPDERELAPEYGGPKGPEPTRYGDWERKGRCVDF